MPNIVEIQNWITRNDLKRNPLKYFLFGDNWEEKGFGGQAGQMRGERNAIGIPTKKKPTMHPDAFLDDEEYFQNIIRIDKAIDKIPDFVTVVIPGQGLGTGLAQMPHYAPATYKYLQVRLKQLALYDRHVEDIGRAYASALEKRLSSENELYHRKQKRR